MASIRTAGLTRDLGDLRAVTAIDLGLHISSPTRWLKPPYVSALLSARGQCSADLAQDDADTLLALHLADSLAPRDAPDADGATLPVSHPVHQLVRAAAWLVSHPPFVA